MITDPFFYLVAIPAVLLLGLSKSGFGAGFGSLAVPMMALAVTVPDAAAILMPVLLVMDLLGVRALWLLRDRALIRLLVPAGLLGSLQLAGNAGACSAAGGRPGCSCPLHGALRPLGSSNVSAPCAGPPRPLV